MTLIETIREIESAAIRQPSVNMIVRSDVLRINKTPDRRYGIFAWTQMQHSASLDNDFINYVSAFSTWTDLRRTGQTRRKFRVLESRHLTISSGLSRKGDSKSRHGHISRSRRGSWTNAPECGAKLRSQSPYPMCVWIHSGIPFRIK